MSGTERGYHSSWPHEWPPCYTDIRRIIPLASPTWMLWFMKVATVRNMGVWGGHSLVLVKSLVFQEQSLSFIRCPKHIAALTSWSGDSEHWLVNPPHFKVSLGAPSSKQVIMFLMEKRYFPFIIIYTWYYRRAFSGWVLWTQLFWVLQQNALWEFADPSRLCKFVSILLKLQKAEYIPVPVAKSLN